MSVKAACAVVLLLVVVPVAAFTAGCSSHSPQTPPAPPPAEAFNAGQRAYEQGNFEQAATLFAAAGTPQAKVYLGQSLTRDAAKKAFTAYDEALRADPGLDDAMEAMGLLLANQGETAQAKPWLIKAGTTGGLSPEALLRLGDIFLAEGNCREALAAYEKAAAPQVGYAPAARRLEAVRGLCGGKAALAGGPGKGARNGPADGDPAAGLYGQGAKSGRTGASQTPAKQKPGPKTIDLNDI
ncbi:tetratricopeptide repeat protein [Desulfolutivibrio sp.]|uniref:tetratricopeptide repeat protein n=1 Tax=Desulfolutivibrio sp. TaxID=2773296 RepID=UPI002F963F81